MPEKEVDRTSLPDGFIWAEWSGKADSVTVWSDLDKKPRQTFRTRFKEVIASLQCGRMLPSEKFFHCKDSNGIHKAKVLYPSPGMRAWVFQAGGVWCVSHISDKGDKDHDMQVEIAQDARRQHLAHLERTKKAHDPNTPR